jgi:2-polyprenyl-6-methoxyphenol hydroxylase-like FAD-dependent oxidoreductase
MATLPTRTEVLIVGGGPVGLTMACALGTLGVEHLVIDRAAAPAPHSRAATLHARTVETLAGIGVADELVDRGLRCGTFTIRDGGQVLVSVPFADLPSPYPFALTVPQDVTEAVLAGRLAALGGHLHREVALLDLYERHPGWVAVVAGVDGVARVVHADWVIGCDGLHSTVRDRAGISFPGQDRDQSFLLAEADMDWRAPAAEVTTFHFSPAGLAVVALMPNGLHRVVAPVPNGTPAPRVADVQAVLDVRAPGGRAVVRAVAAGSVWRVRERLAEVFRRGSLFLAGDAGHAHSPVGGQGLNTGVQDAVNLAWKLAAVRAGTAAPALLDTYEAERRPVAAALLAFAGQLTDVATMSRPDSIALRNEVLGAVGGLPAFTRWFGERLAQLSLAYPAPADPATPGHPGVGERMAPTAGMATGLGWSLVGPPGFDVPAVRAAAAASATPLAVTTADIPHAVLVRPDGHVAGTAPAGTAAALPARLARWLTGAAAPAEPLPVRLAPDPPTELAG